MFQIQRAGFAVVAKDAINWMAIVIGDRRSLEVGAGSGRITSELLDLGINTVVIVIHIPPQNSTPSPPWISSPLRI